MSCPCHMKSENRVMSFDNLVGLFVAIALVAYLVAALIKPERF